MKATVSLKQLRNDPREYVRLLTSGYEVEITEHRKTIATAIQPPGNAERGNVTAVLEAIKALPAIKDPDPGVDTPTRLKQIKSEHLAKKYAR
jgi:antitoxin (DNA-binding transcriptional repressor) of toxin-antitoxin stability system